MFESILCVFFDTFSTDEKPRFEFPFSSEHSYREEIEDASRNHLDAMPILAEDTQKTPTDPEMGELSMRGQESTESLVK